LGYFVSIFDRFCETLLVALLLAHLDKNPSTLPSLVFTVAASHPADVAKTKMTTAAFIFIFSAVLLLLLLLLLRCNCGRKPFFCHGRLI
jgi:hypothetical protein